MPICQTCRGEYASEKCLCLNCLQPLGRGVKLCHNCGAETHGKRLCPRCKNDVAVWEKENYTLLMFIRQGGSIGLIPSLVALLAWLVFWWPRNSQLHHPIVTVAAIAFSQIVIIVLYTTRLSWRDRSWGSQVYGSWPASLLTIAMSSTFFASMVMAGISFVLYKLWDQPGAPEIFSRQLFFGLVYAPVFVLSTASLTLMAIKDYMDRLDQRVPVPIFVNIDRLARVTVETAIRSMGAMEDEWGRREVVNGDPNRTYDILEVVRLDDGGIRLLLNIGQVVPDNKGNAGEKRVDRFWRIEGDRWGRVREVKPGRHTSD